MPRHSYTLVDVFTDRPFGGNPLAVFPDATGISPELMQPIAREFNLSETTFVLPPADQANDCRVRIFTPVRELPLAGHPTIGTAFVLAGARTNAAVDDTLTLRLEEGVGTVPVTVHIANGAPDLIWMRQPLPAFTPRPEDRGIFAELLSLRADAVRSTGLPVEVGSCGVPFLYVPVCDLAAIRQARHRPEIAARLPADAHAGNVFVFTREVEHAEATVHCRMFAPVFGIVEDPATGVASGPLGAYLLRHGVVSESGTARLYSEQGLEMGRPSVVAIEVAHDTTGVTGIRVGGRCVRMGEGTLTLP